MPLPGGWLGILFDVRCFIAQGVNGNSGTVGRRSQQLKVEFELRADGIVIAQPCQQLLGRAGEACWWRMCGIYCQGGTRSSSGGCPHEAWPIFDTNLDVFFPQHRVHHDKGLTERRVICTRHDREGMVGKKTAHAEEEVSRVCTKESLERNSFTGPAKSELFAAVFATLKFAPERRPSFHGHAQQRGASTRPIAVKTDSTRVHPG